MITNPKIIKNKYGCGKIITQYLMYECQLPILGYNKDKKVFYFADTEKLRKCLKEMPLHLKAISLFRKH